MEYGEAHPSTIFVADLLVLKYQLMPQLGYQESTARDELVAAFAAAETLYLCDPVGVAERAADLLADEAEDIAQKKDANIADEVIEGYPERYTGELQSTRQYMKANDTPSHYRQLMARARSLTIDTSKATLRERMATDRQEFQLYDPGLHAADLAEDVSAVVTELQGEIENVVSEIKDLIPDNVAKMDAEIRRTLERLKMPEEAALLIGPDGEMRRLSTDRTEINRAMGRLAKLITAMGDPDYLSTRVAARHRQEVEIIISNYIRNRYELIARYAGSELPEQLEAAYARTAGVEYVYVSDAQREREKSIMPLVEFDVTKDADKDQSTEFSIESVDVVASPFPWFDGLAEMKLISEGDRNILFCEALSPAAEQIWRSVGRETRNRKIYDTLVDRFLRIEITNPTGLHTHIDRLAGQLGEDYSGLTIFKFGNVGANAKRVYYAKTNADRYPELQKLTEGYGLPASTPLIMLLGKTDKANQLQMISSFGVPRSFARAKGIE